MRQWTTVVAFDFVISCCGFYFLFTTLATVVAFEFVKSPLSFWERARVRVSSGHFLFWFFYILHKNYYRNFLEKLNSSNIMESHHFFWWQKKRCAKENHHLNKFSLNLLATHCNKEKKKHQSGITCNGFSWISN